jgi:putative DNA methylase
MPDREVRKIDRWFPIEAVDEAVGNPAGSGLSEKALMTWFAARPIAQARAATLTALLPDINGETQRLIDIAVRGYDKAAMDGNVHASHSIEFDDAVVRLTKMIDERYPDGPPVVLDPFSGRGILPLEAARFGARAIGIDLAPLAVLASRLLADYPYRDWSSEPDLPADWYPQSGGLLNNNQPKLVRDVEAFLHEVGRRLEVKAESYYPRNPDGRFPWGYLCAVTITCDGCQRRFPLVGSLVLRHPYAKTGDRGQWMRLVSRGDTFYADTEEGIPQQQPSFAGSQDSRQKTARCLFCGHVHSRDTIKRKGFAGNYRDIPLVASDTKSRQGAKVFRPLREDEIDSFHAAEQADLAPVGRLSVIPDERIPAGNNDTVRASGYGYTDYGSLMNRRQALQFALNSEAIRELSAEAQAAGASIEYVTALTGYAAATLSRRVKYATRGAPLRTRGNSTGNAQNRTYVDHIYAQESKVSDGFDYIEAGPGEGPGTWHSLVSTSVNALSRVMEWPSEAARSGRFRWGTATALPLRDKSVDACITDPPYLNMIDYSDASDLLYVWVRRALHDVMPDVFGPDAPSLQPKEEEIIVKRGGTDNDHRTADWYHRQLAAAFTEIRRVLKNDGHLTVVFGHHDPEAWVRLLSALHDARFIVTSSWPARTESANTGVASIKVTVTIGCRVAPEQRPDGMMSQVDLEVRREVATRVKRWREDGLAMPDQLMAAYGPAMEVFGRYANVLQPDGDHASLERYLLLARTVVKDETTLVLDSLPLETFDAGTRLAVYWLQVHGLGAVAKGEARFMAQGDAIRLEDVRDMLKETSKGFTLLVEPADTEPHEQTSLFVLARAVAYRWANQGADGVADVLARAVLAGCVSGSSDAHLWAFISELGRVLAPSHSTAKSLAAVQRSRNQIVNLVGVASERLSGDHRQLAIDVRAAL